MAEIFQQSETRVDLLEALTEQYNISESGLSHCELLFSVTGYLLFLVNVDTDRN